MERICVFRISKDGEPYQYFWSSQDDILIAYNHLSKSADAMAATKWIKDGNSIEEIENWRLYIPEIWIKRLYKYLHVSFYRWISAMQRIFYGNRWYRDKVAKDVWEESNV